MKYALAAIGILTIGACASRDGEPKGDTARRSSSGSTASSPAAHAAADSVIAAYLDLSTERDRYDVDRLERMRVSSGPCVEEMYGDGISSYWLARGRLLNYDPRIGDTLPARLELLTVAKQVPDTGSAYDSRVTARIRTDTVTMRLVLDSTRRHWQVCGYLSNGFEFGGYGRPQSTHFDPPSATRAGLLRQVDSIRQTITKR